MSVSMRERHFVLRKVKLPLMTFEINHRRRLYRKKLHWAGEGKESIEFREIKEPKITGTEMDGREKAMKRKGANKKYTIRNKNDVKIRRSRGRSFEN